MDFECLGGKEFVHDHIPALAGWEVPGSTPCAQCKTMLRTDARNPPWWLQCAGSCTNEYGCNERWEWLGCALG